MTSRPCPECRGTGTQDPHPCPDCAGDGRVRARRTLTVKVPAGVEDGMRLRLSGEGEVGPGGGPAGDLYVEIHERDAPGRSPATGNDLHCRVAAADDGRGARHRGQADDAGQRGERHRQAGHAGRHGHDAARPRRAAPDRGVGRGDLHVHFDVPTPTKLDGEQERLLRELAELRSEEHPDGGAPVGSHLFGRLRGAFK